MTTNLSVSDRRWKQAETGVALPVVIDTIAVRGPVDPSALDGAPLQRRRRTLDRATGEIIRENTTSATTRLHGTVDLHIDTGRRAQGVPEARIEFSVPKHLHGHKASASTLREAVDTVGSFYARAQESGRWLCPPEELRVIRLDLVRDFLEVPCPSQLLMQLAAVPATRVPVANVWLNKAQTGVQTLYRGADDRWLARLYCKGEELLNGGFRDLAEEHENTVRYELQLRHRVLREESMSTMSELSEDRLTAWPGATSSGPACRP